MMSRRQLGLWLASGALLSSDDEANARPRERPEPLLINVIASKQNPYYSRWDDGGQAFARSKRLKYCCIETEGRLANAIEKVDKILKEAGGNAIANVDLASNMPAEPFIKFFEANKVHFVTHSFGKPTAHPWNHEPYYVAHIAKDHTLAGLNTAKLLIRSIDNRGQIIGLGGPEKDIPAQQRKIGLEQALAANPNCSLLAFQVAEWEATISFEIVRTLLLQHGSRISGIWAANDRMAIGAVEALRVQGLNGRIPVTGIDGFPDTSDIIASGDLLGTAAWDPYYDGGIGLSIGYHARTKQIDITKEPDGHREFFQDPLMIVRNNVDSWSDYMHTREPNIQWNDVWRRVSRRVF